MGEAGQRKITTTNNYNAKISRAKINQITVVAARLDNDDYAHSTHQFLFYQLFSQLLLVKFQTFR